MDNGRALFLLFWFWALFVVVSLFVETADAQDCRWNGTLDTQQEAMTCCLSLTAAFPGELQSLFTCPRDISTVENCFAENAGTLRSKFSHFQPHTSENCPELIGTSVEVKRVNFVGCAADRPADYFSGSDTTGSLACVDACEAMTVGCAGFGADWFCTADTTGNSCSEGTLEVQDQCDRDPSRPECQCPASPGGAMSPTCLCQADPLIFGDVTVCDDLLGGDGGTDPTNDSDGDGIADGSDPCPFNPDPNCTGSSGGGGDGGGDGGDGGDGTDPPPDEGGGSGGGAGGSGGNGSSDGDATDTDCAGGLPSCEFPGSVACTMVRQLWRNRCDVSTDLSELGPQFSGQGPIWDDPAIEGWTNRDGSAAINDRLGDVFTPPAGVLSAGCPEIPSVQVLGQTLDFPDQTLCAFFAAAGWVVVAFSMIVAIRIVIGGI